LSLLFSFSPVSLSLLSLSFSPPFLFLSTISIFLPLFSHSIMGNPFIKNFKIWFWNSK
jgi:hypothetical protein